MREEYPITTKLQGEVTIHTKCMVTGREELVFKKNAIQPTAARVVAGCLGSVPGTAINDIALFDGVTPQANAIVTSTVTAPPGGPYYVEFKAVFIPSSFSGQFTDLTLSCLGYADFSTLNTGAPVLKTVTEQIMVTWKITIT